MQISEILTRAPMADEQRKKRRRALIAASGSGKVTPRILISGYSLAENSAEDTFIGTLSVVGVTGTPSFSLVNSASNKAKLTGANILAGSSAVNYETTTGFDIVVSVSGVTPSIANTTIPINVTNVVEDTTPAAFDLGASVTGASLSTDYLSNTITLAGMDGAGDITISGTGASYSKNGGAFTTSPGSGVNGDTVQVKINSSGSYSTGLTATLSVGGNVTSATTDTFTVTTMVDPGSGATLPTPTLTLDSGSDSGQSNSDGITKETSLTLTLVTDFLYEGDLLEFKDSGVLINMGGPGGFKEVSAGEAGSSPLDLGIVLSAGAHSLTVKHYRGSEFSDISAACVFTIDTTAPTITTSASHSIDENTQLAISLTANETIASWAVRTAIQDAASVDAAYFETSGTTLRWIGNGTVDYETPNDGGANNTYIVVVRATDTAGNTTDKTITVTVNDVFEAVASNFNAMAFGFPGSVPQYVVMPANTSSMSATGYIVG